MPESHLRWGDRLIVNILGVNEPEFHLAEITRIVDGGEFLEVVVQLGTTRDKWAFTETALGIVGFYRNRRRGSELSTSWSGKSKAHLCIDTEDWISMDAIKRYFGDSKEILDTQKQVREYIFRKDAVAREIEEGKKQPGKWAYDGTPAENELPYRDIDVDERRERLPKGILGKQVTEEQYKLLKQLKNIDEVDIGKVTVQSAVEDYFTVDISLLGEKYRILMEYDDKWDLETNDNDNGRYRVVEAGSIWEVIDWLNYEVLMGTSEEVLRNRFRKEDLIYLVWRLREKVESLESELAAKAAKERQRQREQNDIKESEMQAYTEYKRRQLDDEVGETGNRVSVYNSLVKSYTEGAVFRSLEMAPRRMKCALTAAREFCEENGFMVLQHWQPLDDDE